MCKDAYVILDNDTTKKLIDGGWCFTKQEGWHKIIKKEPEFTPEQEKQRDEWSASLIN